MEAITDWILAVCAMCALAAAIWASWTSRKLLKTELHRNAANNDRERRHQATHITAWTIQCPERQTDDAKPYGVVVRNSSPAAVYDVRIVSTGAKGSLRTPIEMSILPPGEFAVLEGTDFAWSFPKPITEVRGPVRPITKDATWVVDALTFTDAQGLRWRREGALLVAT